MDEPLLAVYGTLRRGCRNHHLLVQGGARFAGVAHVAGQLVVVTDGPYPYPGYVPDGAVPDRNVPDRDGPDGAVAGRDGPAGPPGRATAPRPLVEVELYRVSPALLAGPLDALEGYDPDDEAGSPYLRRLVPLVVAAHPARPDGPGHAGPPLPDRPPAEAWAYVYNRPVEGLAVLADGVWREG